MTRRITWINIGLAAVLVAAVAGGLFWFFRPEAAASTGRTTAVQTGDISETVTATGTVETVGTVDLSFDTSGTIERVPVQAGDKVEADQRLAVLDDASAQQSLTSAKQSYAQAVTSAQQSGLSLQAAQTAVTNAEATAKLNKESYDTTIEQAKQALKDAEKSWSPSCLDPAGACPSTDAWAQLRAAEAEVTSAKTAYEQAVATASSDETTNNLKVNQASVSLAAAQAKASSDCSSGTSSACTSAQSGVTSAQQNLENAQNAQKVAAQQSQQSLQNADARITTANISLKKLQSSLAKQAADSTEEASKSLESAKLAKQKGTASDEQSIQNARQSLASLQAGAATVDTGAGSTSTSQAAIAVAEQGVQTAQASIEATVLRAPVAGVIGSVVLEAGQQAAPGTTVMTLVPDAGYQVEAEFSEADSLKLAVGQAATITFDALSGESAEGTVTAVNVLPTTGGDVTTYGATITLTDAPDQVRDGMSVSVVVTVDEVTDVLWVPSAAVTTAGGLSTVTVRKDGVDSTVQVTTGLAGDSGTEITSGLQAGDQVVISTAGVEGGGFPGGGFPGGGGLSISVGGGPGGGGPAGGGGPGGG